MRQTFTFKIKQSQTVIQFTLQILYAITGARLDNLVFTNEFIYRKLANESCECKI